MSIAFDIKVQDYATPAIAAKLAVLQPREWMPHALESVKVLWRNQLAALPDNKHGWPSTGFWERGARSITAAMTSPTAGAVTADHQGLRQRWLGGPIKPVNAGALTIPIASESYGKRASEFANLKLVVLKKGAFLAQSLFQKVGRTKAGKLSRRGKQRVFERQQLKFLFKLSKGVDQEGNPLVVPTEDEVAEVVLATIDRRNQ